MLVLQKLQRGASVPEHETRSARQVQHAARLLECARHPAWSGCRTAVEPFDGVHGHGRAVHRRADQRAGVVGEFNGGDACHEPAANRE